MNFFKGIVKELLERKLWPIALVLIVALVAVPILLSKQAPTDLLVQKPLNLPPISSGTTLPAISVKANPNGSKLSGNGRNPFTPQEVATTTTSATPAPTTTGSTGSVGSTGSTGSTGTGSIGSSGSTGGSTVPATTTPSTSTTPATTPSAPTKPAAPAPAGLTDKQAYDVDLSITTPTGGVNAITPITRLAPMPSKQQPLVIELGVLQGGKKVLFAVQRGTVVSGPGTCTPGPIDCEILSLSPGQTEGLSVQTQNGVVSEALFQVTGIGAHDYATAAAADQARRNEDPAGRTLLGKSALNALSLFQYQPTVGALVDLRTLTVGGS